MQKYRKISALFLLSIFSMFMLHQFLPHEHHQHDGSTTSLEKAKHHHHHHNQEHGHHHHSQGKNNDLSTVLFGFLLEIHTHTSHSNGFLEIENIVINRNKAKVFSTSALARFSLFSICECRQLVPILACNPHIESSPFLSARSVRGPPV